MFVCVCVYIYTYMKAPAAKAHEGRPVLRIRGLRKRQRQRNDLLHPQRQPHPLFQEVIRVHLHAIETSLRCYFLHNLSLHEVI